MAVLLPLAHALAREPARVAKTGYFSFPTTITETNNKHAGGKYGNPLLCRYKIETVTFCAGGVILSYWCYALANGDVTASAWDCRSVALFYLSLS